MPADSSPISKMFRIPVPCCLLLERFSDQSTGGTAETSRGVALQPPPYGTHLIPYRIPSTESAGLLSDGPSGRKKTECPIVMWFRLVGPRPHFQKSLSEFRSVNLAVGILRQAFENLPA